MLDDDDTCLLCLFFQCLGFSVDFYVWFLNSVFSFAFLLAGGGTDVSAG